MQMPLKVFRVGLIASQRKGGGDANRLPPPLFWKLNLLRQRSLWPLMEPIKWKLTTRRHLERFDSTSQREGLEGSDVRHPLLGQTPKMSGGSAPNVFRYHRLPGRSWKPCSFTLDIVKANKRSDFWPANRIFSEAVSSQASRSFCLYLISPSSDDDAALMMMTLMTMTTIMMMMAAIMMITVRDDADVSPISHCQQLRSAFVKSIQ